MTKEELKNRAKKFVSEIASGTPQEMEYYANILAEFACETTKELETENAELEETIRKGTSCGDWNDDVHDCEFRHYAMEYGSKLTEAKDIIKGLLESCYGYNSKSVNYEIKARAEQFLKEE